MGGPAITDDDAVMIEADRALNSRAEGPALEDRLLLEQGRVYLNGIQALVRLPIDQARRDRKAGLRIGTFITGYQGSPLGGYDIALTQARKVTAEYGIKHVPAQNEELGATALMGTQMLERYPHSRYDGVTGFWYGKGPGLDRAGDAVRHGNYAGTTTNGAVVILSGEDHEAKSSTMPFQQEWYFVHAGIPVLYPSSVAEFLEFGLHAIAMSRFSGCWVAMKLVGQLCDGGETIDVTPGSPGIILPHLEIDGRPFQKQQYHRFFPGETVETERLLYAERHVAATAYSRANRLDHVAVGSPTDRTAILTAGKSYADTRQAMLDMGITDNDLQRAGIRLIKIGAIYPADQDFIREATTGLAEVIVVEEKRGFLEERTKEALCNIVGGPTVIGKRDEVGAQFFPDFGALDSDMITERLGPRLLPHLHGGSAVRHRLQQIASVRGRVYKVQMKRTPNYCSGCPHNVSTKVLEGQVAWGAPGCHVFAAIIEQPERHIDATFQYGGEGLAWIGLSPFTDLTHVFQNQGDGGLFHSSYQNIRFSIATGVNMTYKILFNGFVANTGAQKPVGAVPVADLANLLAIEGVKKIAIIAKDPRTYRHAKLPSVARVHSVRAIDEVLRDLENSSGVTVFLYDGLCANEVRREQKRQLLPKPTKFVVINEDVCENCGHCGALTNCMSLQKVNTEFGPKTQVHQSSCNQDHACLGGDCPSFLSVESEGGVRRPLPPAIHPDDIPEPKLPKLDRPFHIYIPGVGGTGVLTINSVLAWAGLIDKQHVLTYDQTGAAQKWGAVISSIIIAARGELSAANKIGLGKADLYLAFDVMAGADGVNLDRCDPSTTAAVINTTLLPSGEMIRDVKLSAPVDSMVAAIESVTNRQSSVTLEARELAETLFGDYMAGNMIGVGAAYQAGLLPIRAAAIESAIVLNGAAVEQNLQAFRYGRLVQHDPRRVWAIARPAPLSEKEAGRAARQELPSGSRPEYDRLLTMGKDLDEELRRVLAVRVSELIHYQDSKYAAEYAGFVLRVATVERRAIGQPGDLKVTREVARQLYKLMAYKDEYEVARLHLKSGTRARLRSMFSGRTSIHYNLHPPFLRALGLKRKLRLGEWFNPFLAVLAAAKMLRRTPFDVFGYARIRREERRLIPWYTELVERALTQLRADNQDQVAEIGRLPDGIRGYEEIKARNIAEVTRRAEFLLRGLDGRVKTLRVVSPTNGKP